MLTFETDGGFLSHAPVRGAASRPRRAPWPGGGLSLDSHITDPSGWRPTRAPAPQRSRSIVYEVLSISTRRAESPRRRSSRWQPQPEAAPGVPSGRRTTSEPWASWNVSAATASRRRPTTASPRRCRRSTSRRARGVPSVADFIGTRRLRQILSLWKASGPSRDPTPPAGKRYKSPVAHVQEAR